MSGSTISHYKAIATKEMEPQGKMKGQWNTFLRKPQSCTLVLKDGIVLYSNEAAQPLLMEGDAESEKNCLPMLGDIVQTGNLPE